MSTAVSQAGSLELVRISPDDRADVTALADFYNAAMAVDDPGSPPAVPAILAGELAYGWDLDPDERYFCRLAGTSEPVGVLGLDLPERDNRHLVWAALTVHPEHRRRGLGTQLMAELVRRVEAAGRTTIWLGVPADDEGSQAFLRGSGFHFANPDARRRQVLAEVDSETVARLASEAREKASDYVLERHPVPSSEELLAELVAVTAAINDAPMGELTFEDEKFDLPRLRDIETAQVRRGFRTYRVLARHRTTGEIGGHTVVLVHPDQPHFGHQGDTTVTRAHRGHRLGLLLKIEMLRWLTEVEPQLEVIETWNQAGNDFMISVNEALGYRLDRVFQLWERSLD